MNAKSIWLGVESLPIELMGLVLSHPSPIFCGCLSACREHLAVAETLLEQAGRDPRELDWHEVAIGTTIGQGYLADLLRQCGPIEQIVWVWPEWAGALAEASVTIPRDEALIRARTVIEGVLVMASGAAAAVASERGITVTLLLPDSVPANSPHEQGLWAFVERFAATANAASTSKGVSFRLLTQSEWRQATTP